MDPSCGISNIDAGEVVLNGLVAGAGGGIGGAIGNWRSKPYLIPTSRSKWNPKHYAEKVGSAKPFPPTDLNDIDRELVTGFAGGLAEHSINGIGPDCGCENETPSEDFQ